MMHRLRTHIALAMTALAPFAAGAQTVTAPFASTYTATNLGSVAGVPTSYGGITFLNANTLLLGGSANGPSGSIYTVSVTRDAQNRVVSFGAPTLLSTAPFIDGGLTMGPGGVLFFAGFPNNTLGQIVPGGSTPAKTIDLTPFGISSSVGSIGFVPAGFAGAGRVKILSYNGGGVYDVVLAPDGSGTYNVVSATLTSSIGGGPEGIAFVPLGSPLFGTPSALVSLYQSNVVRAYQLDAQGNPIAATGVDFVTGLNGAEGATIDPVTGDFLFSTFGGTNTIVRVSGFAAPPQPPTSNVPEPSTYALMAAGLVAIGATRRRRVT